MKNETTIALLPIRIDLRDTEHSQNVKGYYMTNGQNNNQLK